MSEYIGHNKDHHVDETKLSHDHSPHPHSSDLENGDVKSAPLARSLKGRHMQMIAIGGAIGAGLFVGSGSALHSGGPASLLLGYIITGIMLLLTVQALGEMAVLYPVNGAFFNYIVRFVDPSWGFAVGWDYALNWLIILPFEITAAGLTIKYWGEYNIGIWIAVFLAILTAVQFFGVRGYGEVEFVLAIIKIAACAGFIILGIIINCGGVPGDNRGYIGARYWHDGRAFQNSFKGFCSVFVTAAFAFSGTELTGLAAAEAANPRKSLPKACRQVFWRIAFFYVLNIFILGLIVDSNSDYLLNSSGAGNTQFSPFIVAIKDAGIKVLPSIFNAVITIAVISVANSATYGSTRTIQALAVKGMAPKQLAYVDKKGRPVPVIILQLIFGLLAFVNEAPEVGNQFFNWLLALAGLSNFFIWGSICLAHIRFRMAWTYQGRTLSEIPYKAYFGIPGSAVGLFLNFMCLVFQFYVALFPIGGDPPDAEAFFGAYLAAPITLALFVGWKAYTVFTNNLYHRQQTWRPYVLLSEMNLHEGMRDIALDTDDHVVEKGHRTIGQKILGAPKSLLRAFF
ncbi:AAT family amino acid transporter [Pseudovirgaria hyperparasitica]|uniref:AAT family amino acid transporter n=1 Tax=Pseudovirgaria hyperparasitica TaxID=470096 RepID=A0A6A6VUD8_9PEZI|nr:AAT family amino acid transporter [Pseudovirgaria hyperparasitica]KAF2752861.1 AAT family amino acid transporter [Pseudovirgaria hyperparasitica]